MGLNPGGDPSKEPIGSLEMNINNYWYNNIFHSYSGFVDRCWHSEIYIIKAGIVSEYIQYNPGKLPEVCPIRSAKQKVVPVAMQAVMQELYSIIDKTLNAIFMQSKRGSVDLPGNDLISKISNGNVKEFFKKYIFTIHKYIFEAVKPGIVLCLGHGEGVSAFDLFRDAYKIKTKDVAMSDSKSNPKQSKYWKYFRDKESRIHFLGIHHPAWRVAYPIGGNRINEISEKIKELSN